MAKFSKGDKVVFVKNCTTFLEDQDISNKIGTVVKCFDAPPVALVNFDGETIKVSTMVLAKAPAPEKSEETNDQDPTASVTLTRKQFQKFAIDATNPVRLSENTGGKMDPGTLILLGMAAAIIIKDLEGMIFGDDPDHD